MPCLSQYSGREADSMFNQWDPQASFAWFDSVFLFGDSSLIPRNCTLGCRKWEKGGRAQWLIFWKNVCHDMYKWLHHLVIYESNFKKSFHLETPHSFQGIALWVVENGEKEAGHSAVVDSGKMAAMICTSGCTT